MNRHGGADTFWTIIRHTGFLRRGVRSLVRPRSAAIGAACMILLLQGTATAVAGYVEYTYTSAPLSDYQCELASGSPCSNPILSPDDRVTAQFIFGFPLARAADNYVGFGETPVDLVSYLITVGPITISSAGPGEITVPANPIPDFRTNPDYTIESGFFDVTKSTFGYEDYDSISVAIDDEEMTSAPYPPDYPPAKIRLELTDGGVGIGNSTLPGTWTGPIALTSLPPPPVPEPPSVALLAVGLCAIAGWRRTRSAYR